MNNNKHNLEIGQTVILDKDRPNESKVVIKHMTPNKLFSTVHTPDHPDNDWDVMTNRLFPESCEVTSNDIKESLEMVVKANNIASLIRSESKGYENGQVVLGHVGYGESKSAFLNDIAKKT